MAAGPRDAADFLRHAGLYRAAAVLGAWTAGLRRCYDPAVRGRAELVQRAGDQPLPWSGAGEPQHPVRRWDRGRGLWYWLHQRRWQHGAAGGAGADRCGTDTHAAARPAAGTDAPGRSSAGAARLADFTAGGLRDAVRGRGDHAGAGLRAYFRAGQGLRACADRADAVADATGDLCGAAVGGVCL